MTTARLWVTLSEGVKNSVSKNMYVSICDVSLVKIRYEPCKGKC